MALGKLEMVFIQLKEGVDDPQIIFESINSTGFHIEQTGSVISGAEGRGNPGRFVALFRAVFLPGRGILGKEMLEGHSPTGKMKEDFTMKKVLALLLALACALPLGVAAAAATGDAIPYPNIGLVVESDLCDGDGAVYSAADVIAPDTTVYFPIEEAAVSKLTDKDFFKVKTDKGDDNSKMIQKVSVTEKNFGTGGRIKGRWVAVKIELKQDITDNEYKLTPEVTFTAKEKVTIGGQEYAEGQKFSIKFKFFMGNTTENADQDYMAATAAWSSSRTRTRITRSPGRTRTGRSRGSPLRATTTPKSSSPR